MTGARGGKRSVTHLSKAQLARKRANDREAQRNIRQRTREHIEALEKRVKELEGGGRSESMERVLKRNEELEEEIEKLREQLELQSELHSPVTEEIPRMGELHIPRNVGWRPPSEDIITAHASHHTTPANEVPPELIPHTWRTQDDVPSTYPEYPPEPAYDEAETSQHLYTPTATPIWDDALAYGTSMTKPAPAWAPFHPALSQPSRFSDLQPGLSEVISHSQPPPPFQNSTSWQTQPSIYAWQISTKLKAPVTHVDHLMISVIQSQRHLHLSENLLGTNLPPVHILFNQPGPAKPPSTLTELMARYSAVLSNRGFALIPEKLASFMCMYRFVQWQIQPSLSTYEPLCTWQTPTPSQLTIPHPAWMDLPPWPKFREFIIERQERYDNPEFQECYVSNLCVNWGRDPMLCLVFEGGEVRVSKCMEKHVSRLENMSMKRPFCEKYPEFRDVCRFDEV